MASRTRQYGTIAAICTHLLCVEFFAVFFRTMILLQLAATRLSAAATLMAPTALASELASVPSRKLLPLTRHRRGGGSGSVAGRRCCSWRCDRGGSAKNYTCRAATALLLRGGAEEGSSRTSTFSTATTPKPQPMENQQQFRYRAYLAVGSNLGDRYQNIRNALGLLCRQHQEHEESDGSGASSTVPVKVVKTSFLHETAPMYVTDQPRFVNGALIIDTDLEPRALLDRIKLVEAELGRDLDRGVRNGPRPVDLDILLYERKKVGDGENEQQNIIPYEPVVVAEEDEDGEDGGGTTRTRRRDLIVPHPRMQERDFVLLPLLEVGGAKLLHPVLNATVAGMIRLLDKEKKKRLQHQRGSGEDRQQTMVRVLPLPRDRMLYMNETLIMGILNVTPDSFSDGGDLGDSVSTAVSRALEMEKEGASIIDIGGESTRPGAEEVDVETEIQRTVPVIESIRKESDVPISIDTRHSRVARSAVEAGADIVNDVSAGTHDPNMLQTVAELGVPMILMHMRGTPRTMQSMTDYGGENNSSVVEEVAGALVERSSDAAEAGIHRWMQIVDPGIGFAKDLDGNLALLKNIKAIRDATGNLPILLGTSRKGFIGKVSNVDVPKQRDPGTVASCVAALCLDSSAPDSSCNILRVHNVPDNKQAAMVMDAILKSRLS